MCAIRPLHIYHLAAAVTYVWCFWCILVHSDFLFSALGFFSFFTWCCISLVFYIILLWLNSSVLKIFLLNFSRSTCNNNVTQPQSFLIGILFSVYAIWNGVTPMKMSFLLSFHFQVILVDLLVQVQNVKKFLIYYFRRDSRFMKHKYSAGTMCIHILNNSTYRFFVRFELCSGLLEISFLTHL